MQRMTLVERLAARRASEMELPVVDDGVDIARQEAERVEAARVVEERRLAQAAAVASVIAEEQRVAYLAQMDEIYNLRQEGTNRRGDCKEPKRYTVKAVQEQRRKRDRERQMANRTPTRLRAVAASGYETFYRTLDRHVDPFDTAPNWRTHLWVEMADLVARDGDVAAVWDVWRSNKLDYPGWDDLSVFDRLEWMAVHEAMQHERARLAEAMLKRAARKQSHETV